ncbi:hypothetical protein D3C71_1644490 [compost metagenome]
MVVATQAALLDEGIGQVGTTVRALTVDQAIATAQILVEHQVFAHEPDSSHGLFIKLGRGCDRHPVAAQQVAHRRVWPHLGQLIILFLTKHQPVSPVLTGVRFRACGGVARL